MKIMTYNLRYASDTPPNAWDDRKELMVELLEQTSPDIIGTQEGLFHQLQDLEKALPNYGWIGLGREGGNRGEFMAIFYKKAGFEVLEFDHFWLSDSPQTMGDNSWGNSCVRMATWVRFLDKETDKQFYVLNTHFDHVSEEGRQKSAELLIKMSETFTQEIPLMITGDFNAGEDSVPYQVLVNDGPFTDVWETAGRKTNAEIGSFNDFTDPLGHHVRIDWLLYQGGLQVKSVETIDQAFDGKFPSDHFPIVAEVELVGKA